MISMKIDRLLARKAELRAQLNAELRFCHAKYRRWIAEVDAQIKRLRKAETARTSPAPLRPRSTRSNSNARRISISKPRATLLHLVRSLLADLDEYPLTAHSLAQMIFE